MSARRDVQYWIARNTRQFLSAEQNKNKVLKTLTRDLQKASTSIGKEVAYYSGKYYVEGPEGRLIDYHRVLDKVDRLENYKEWKYYKKEFPQYYTADLPLSKVLKPKTVRDALKHKTLKHSIDFGEVVGKKAVNLLGTIYSSSYASTVKDLGIRGLLVDIDPKQLKRVIESKWIGNRNFSQRLWGDTNKMAFRAFTKMETAIKEGKDPKWIERELYKDFGGEKWGSRYPFKRLVNTEMTRINTEASLDAFKEMGDTQYQILSVLDKRTSEICREMDGKKFKIADFQVGINAPPFHPNCRSMIIPVED